MNIDRLSEAKGLTAPRTTLQDLEDNIVHIEIVKHISHSGQVLRWAILTVRSGFSVTGRHSCSVSSANDDQEIGERIAIENAKKELWAFMSYSLQERLSGF
jgi:hypothetical protein